MYRTPSGRFFLAGSGGATTVFRQPGDGARSWRNGSGITAILTQDAFEMAQRYLPATVIEEFFADMFEDA